MDAKNKNVELDDKYSKFMDLATEFKKTYPRLSASSASLRKMADALDVTIDTEAARGLPFCKQVIVPHSANLSSSLLLSGLELSD